LQPYASEWSLRVGRRILNLLTGSLKKKNPNGHRRKPSGGGGIDIKEILEPPETAKRKLEALRESASRRGRQRGGRTMKGRKERKRCNASEAKGTRRRKIH